MLGIVDPRTLYHSVDSELMALWLAHFALKREAAEGGQSEPNPRASTPRTRVIDHQNVDQQVNVCERLLM